MIFFQVEISYCDQKVVGNGSFGVVFVATLQETKELVAIKKVLQDKRFKNRELQIMRKLSHPNIVKLKWVFFCFLFCARHLKVNIHRWRARIVTIS